MEFWKTLGWKTNNGLVPNSPSCPPLCPYFGESTADACEHPPESKWDTLQCCDIWDRTKMEIDSVVPYLLCTVDQQI